MSAKSAVRLIVERKVQKLTAAAFPPDMTDPLGRAVYVAVAGAASLAVLSVAASQIMLAAAIGGMIWIRLKNGRTVVYRPPSMWPLLAFCLWTIVTVLLSARMYPSVLELKKFFLYAILFLVPIFVRSQGAALLVFRAIFFFSAISCVKGIAQFISNPHRDLLNRISGFMSQWMTYSGLLMLALVAVAAFIACSGWRRNKLLVFLGLLLVVSLLLSETRNAWAGAVAGIAAVVLLRRPKALAGFLVLLLAAYFVLPPALKNRLHTGFDPADPNTRNRIELFETSLRMIRANPLLGVGPKNVEWQAQKYRGSNEYPGWMYQHMHNNLLQIAAERGIPGALIWIWLMIAFARDGFRVFRSAGGGWRTGPSEDPESLAAPLAALGAWTALAVAGMFEYNFGDSEIITLFLFLMAAPFCGRTGRIPPLGQRRVTAENVGIPGVSTGGN